PVGVVGGDGESIGVDLDDFVRRIGEVDADGLWAKRIAVTGNAREDLALRLSGVARVGVEHADGVADGVVGGIDAVLGVEGVSEPIAEAGGGERAGLVCEGAGGDGGPSVAGFGGEGGGQPDGVVEYLFGDGGDLLGHFLLPNLLLGGSCQVISRKSMIW